MAFDLHPAAALGVSGPRLLIHASGRWLKTTIDCRSAPIPALLSGKCKHLKPIAVAVGVHDFRAGGAGEPSAFSPARFGNFQTVPLPSR
jgi:hypothetical protein